MSFHFLKYSLCLVLLLISGWAWGQKKYSAQDLAAIQQKRRLTQQAMDKWDRKALYHLGLFYESLYQKYSDTSIRAAVRCYEASAFTEGEFFHQESLLAAYRLGGIYELGTGVPVQTEKALVYYFVSGSKGGQEFSRLQQTFCPADTVLHNSIGRHHPADSLVIGIVPFCSLHGAATANAMARLAEFLQQNPEWQVQLSARMAEPGITAPYNLWVQAEALPRRCGEIRSYLVDQVGIASERVLDGLPVETGGNRHLVIVSVRRQKDQ